MKFLGKRILSVVTALIMLMACAALPVSAASSQGFEYEVIQGSTSVRITGYSGLEANVTIPDILDGRTVVEIGSGAFAGHTGIRSVTISSNVLRIMKESFSDCSSLESVVIPASVASIGDSAFSDCVALKDVTISSAYTSIGYYAFEGCTALESITIPSSKIGYAAFRNCKALETIRLLDSVQSVGRYAFDSTAWYKEQPEGLLTVGRVVYGVKGNIADIVIPDGMICIADYAFSGSDISSVVIPDGMYYIGNFAFADTNKLTYISVPESIISIGTKALGYAGNALKPDFKVYCYDNSVAYMWATNNSIATESIDDCKHSFGDWIINVDPDCVTGGSKMHRCIKCNFVENESVDAKGHSWSGWVTISELSCTTDGVKRRTCTVCGLTDDDIQLTNGHTWGEWTVSKEPDCVNQGERSHSCTVCGVSKTENTDPVGHKWIVNDTTDENGWIVTAEPTCDEIGVKTRICYICEATDNLSIEVLGHKADEWIVTKDPSAVAPGEKQGTCNVCGDIFTEEIPMISEEMPDNVKMLTLADNAKVEFNENRTCLYGVTPGTTVDEVRLQFKYPGHILVTDMAPTQLTGDTKIGSGCFLFLIKYNEETQQSEPIDTTCVIINGDLNGDGAVTASDAREALRASAKLTELQSPFFLAGDLDGDKSVTAVEARKILRVAGKLDQF